MSKWISAIVNTMLGFNQTRYDREWDERLNYLIDNCKFSVDFHDDKYCINELPEAHTMTFNDNGKTVTVWCENFPYSFSYPYRNRGTGVNVNLKVRASIPTMIKLKEMFDLGMRQEKERMIKENKAKVM